MSCNDRELPTILGQPGADFPTVFRAMSHALALGQGFSAIRLGDGEGVVLAHDDPGMAPDVDEKKHTWFGAQSLDASEWDEIREGLEQAIASADVLGMPRPFQLGKHHRYRILLPAVERVLGTHRPMMSDNGLHFFLQWSGALGTLMMAAKRIVVIGCRDVEHLLREELDLPRVKTLLVRGEERFPGAVEDRHWPDGYARVLTEISGFGPGDLVLVGAGPLGKIYCMKARESGAVAIDLGSLLDAWVSVPSRHLFKGPDADLFRISHLRDTPSTPEDARKRIEAIVSGTRHADGIF